MIHSSSPGSKQGYRHDSTLGIIGEMNCSNRYDSEAVKVRRLEVRRELKIVYRRDKHLSRAAQTFIEMARE
jgi:hypothetical protein